MHSVAPFRTDTTKGEKDSLERAEPVLIFLLALAQLVLNRNPSREAVNSLYLRNNGCFQAWERGGKEGQSQTRTVLQISSFTVAQSKLFQRENDREEKWKVSPCRISMLVKLLSVLLHSQSETNHHGKNEIKPYQSIILPFTTSQRPLHIALLPSDGERTQQD